MILFYACLFFSFLQSLMFLSQMVLRFDKFYQHQSFCLQQVTQIQKQHRFLLNQLFLLNPKASLLRTERQQAQRALIRAPDPYSKSVAAAWLSKVVLKQKTLRILQQKIISNFLLSTQNWRFKLKTKGNFQINIKPFNRIIRKHPPHSLTPNYLKTVNFSYQKRITLTDFFHLAKKRTKYKCTSTLTTYKNKLGEIRIIGDKYLLNRFIF